MSIIPLRSQTVRTAVGRPIFPTDGIGPTSNQRLREHEPEPAVIPGAVELLDPLTSR
jgi:hypothetical protein